MTPQTFIGTKVIKAWPEAKNGEAGYAVQYPDGYTSWSPKAVFEEAYRPFHGLTFGMALEALKKGFTVARAGWNGSGMFAYLVPAASYPAQTGAAKAHFGEGAMVPYRAYLALKTAQGDVATWAPSGSDALAEDWYVVEG